MLAAYSIQDSGYASLMPKRELGDDLATAMYLVGKRVGQPLGISQRKFVLVTSAGQIISEVDTIQDARAKATRECFNGPVVICMSVARGQTVLYDQVERIEAMSIGESARRDNVFLVSPGGILLEKALNPHSTIDMKAFSKRMANQLQQIDRKFIQPHLNKMLKSLKLDWSKMSPADIERAFKTARKIMRSVGTSKLLPSWNEKVKSDVEVVANATRKYVKNTFAPRIALSFSQPDMKAVEQISTQQGWFLRDEYGRRADALTNKGRGIVEDGLKKGLGPKAIGKNLREELPSLWAGRGKAYAEVVASNAVSRARSISELASYQSAGFKYLEVQAMLDEATTEVCRYMDGQIIDVQKCVNLAQEAASVKTPEDIYKTTPFMEVRQKRDKEGQVTERNIYTRTGTKIAQVQRSGIGRTDDRGQHKAFVSGNKLPEKGVGTPPYHHRCRTLTVPRIEMVQVPKKYSARAAPVTVPPVSCPKSNRKWSEKADLRSVCASIGGRKQNASGAITKKETRREGTVIGDPEATREPATWKPPQRTYRIKVPEWEGGTIEGHQRAIIDSRHHPSKIANFHSAEMRESTAGPVLKQMATRANGKESTYYTFVDKRSEAKLRKQLKELGKKMPVPAIPKPAPPSKPQKPVAPPPVKLKPTAVPVVPKPNVPIPAGAVRPPTGVTAKDLSRQKRKVTKVLQGIKSQAWDDKTVRGIDTTIANRAIAEGMTAKEIKAAAKLFDDPRIMQSLKAGRLDLAAKQLHAMIRLQWNVTFAERSPVINAYMQAVKTEFNIAGAAIPKGSPHVQQTLEKYFTADAQNAFRKIARATYRYTQETLAKEGIDRVVISRGIRFESTNIPKELDFSGRGMVTNIEQRPLASWSTDDGMALKFAQGGGWGQHAKDAQSMMMCEVKSDRIFSFPKSGIGVAEQSEFVVLGGEDEMAYLGWNYKKKKQEVVNSLLGAAK